MEKDSAKEEDSEEDWEEEDWEDYVNGGYHPVKLGDTFSNNRYVVIRKLGWSDSSTSWLAKDQKYVT